jgi:hypothetical protein
MSDVCSQCANDALPDSVLCEVCTAVETCDYKLDAMKRARDNALAKAEQYKQDWYDAKSEFGTAMAKSSERLRSERARREECEALIDEYWQACFYGKPNKDVDCDCQRCSAVKAYRAKWGL